MKMKAPKGVTGGSFGGIEFDASKRGIVEVPDEAVAELISHGFAPLSGPDAESASADGAGDANAAA